MADQLSLDGKVALVTGARDGIGRAIAVAFARAGAVIAITSRKSDDLGLTVDEIRRAGSRAAVIQADVRYADQAAHVVDSTVADFGRLDILVNNAGVAARGTAIEQSEEAWDLVVDTDLKGPFLMSQVAARAMTGHGGRIINLSSTFAQRPYRGRAAYAAAKAGLEQLTRVLALEWAHLGITVNALALATTLTPSRAPLFDDASLQARINEIPMGRLGTVHDAASAALYLAGRSGGFVTGHVLVVDGGFTLG